MSYGKNYSITNDLHELEQMLRSFESYLKGDQIYGSVGGGFFTGGNNPQLTVGAVLLRLRRLQSLVEAHDHRQKLSTLKEQHNTIYQQHRNRYVDRMQREAHSRLDAMRRFFEECREDRANCPRIYNPEVLRRTIVQEILLEMKDKGITSAELDDKVRRTDNRLRGFVRESNFVWDAQLERVYPDPPFWWMYMTPPADDSR